MTDITRVLIAEDEPLAAEALADWVAQMPSLQLVATCGDGASALAQIRALQPGLVLMDIQMPVLTGLQVLQALARVEDKARDAARVAVEMANLMDDLL